MENYLYFRKIRPASFTHVMSTDQAFTITGVGGDDIDDKDEIATVTVTPEDGSNSNIGSNYSHPGAGVELSLAISAINGVSNSVFTFDNVTQDSANGYNFEADTVTVTFKPGNETCVAYPVSELKAIKATDDTTTVIHFNSIKGDSTDDTITLTHAAGKFDRVCRMINDACNFKSPHTGGLVRVIDGHGGEVRHLASYSDIAVTGMVFAFEVLPA